MIKLLVSLGTYEKTLCGIDFKLDDSDDLKLIEKKVSFAIPAHIGYVKVVASGPKFLVSGSTDETIRIFDLIRRKDFGSLACHSGSISCLVFYKQNMLLSASEDGKIMVTRCADWETLQTLRGHSGGVTALGIHPSGKLALSSGKDRTVKTWNLVTGKIALRTKVDHIVDRIIWSPKGEMYAFVSERHLQIFSTNGAVCSLDYQPSKKLLCAVFLSDHQIAVAGEGNLISVYDFEAKEWTAFETEHKPRIKDLSVFKSRDYFFLASGSSDGLVCIWEFQDNKLKLIASHSSNLRITCLTLTTQ